MSPSDEDLSPKAPITDEELDALANAYADELNSEPNAPVPPGPAPEAQSEPNLHVSLFDNKKDNRPKAVEMRWHDLAGLLVELHVRPEKDGKLIAPVRFHDGMTRQNQNVDSIYLLVLDFDDGSTPESIEPAISGYAHVVYSTHYNQLAKDDLPPACRFRLVIPLLRPVPKSDWPRVYAKLALSLGGDHADPACRDASRMYFLHSCPSAGQPHAFSKVHDGPWLDPDQFPDIEMIEEEPKHRSVTHNPQGQGLPGDDFDKRVSWDELCESHGARKFGQYGKQTLWTRSGKDPGGGPSWATGQCDTGDRLINFSENAGLPVRKPLRKWHVLAYWDFGGNFEACAKHLHKVGYGNRDQSGRPRPTTASGEPDESEDHMPDDPDGESGAGFRSFAAIPRQAVKWLWPPYFPLSAVVAVVGDPGIGKSTFAYHLASAVSRGIGPEGFPSQEPGDVVLYCLEDDAARVIKGRLEEAGADMTRVFDGSFDEEENPTGISPPMTIEKMRLVIDGVRRLPNPKVIIFDPVSEWFPATRSMNKANEAREIYSLFRKLAEDLGLCVLIIGHPNKQGSQSLLYRVSGSIDFSAIVRSGLFAVKVPEGDGYALIHFKRNWGPQGLAIGYDINEDGQFSFTGPIDLTEDMLTVAKVDAPVTATQKKACKDWIERTLANGPMNAKSLFEGAKLEGFSSSTVKRAKKEMPHVHTRKVGGEWVWSLDLDDRRYINEETVNS